MPGWLHLVTLLSALGCGLVAGVFFAFSTFVMKALGRLPPAQGIAAMQSINRVVINPWFMTPFLGTGAGCLVVVGAALLRRHQAGALWLLAGGVLYLAGTLLVTFRCHVPRNQALAAVDPARLESAMVWSAYLSAWTIWNHVRAAAALAAAAAFTLAFRS